MNPLDVGYSDSFEPDYTACELFIRAVGYDIDNSTLIGHRLLLQRSSLKEKSKIWTEIQMKEYGNVWRDCILKAQKRITGSKYRGANKKNIKVEKDTESKSISTNKDTFDNVVINRRMTRQLVKMATIYKVKPIVKKKAYQKKGRSYRYCCLG